MKRDHADVLREVLDLAGKRVVDVGCGDGKMVRVMASAGAHVIGIECGKLPLAAARAAVPAGDEQYLEGVGEALPVPDTSQDIVVFFNSLHHVPVAQQSMALAEASRALEPGGLVYIAEPLPQGPNFEAGRLVDDETEVRTRALEALRAADRVGLDEAREITYTCVTHHESFDAFRASKILVDEMRRKRFDEHSTELQAAYDKFGVERSGGREFDQPMRVNLLRKARSTTA